MCVAAYVIVSPTGGHNGGTPLGYTLGSLSTLGILYLTWFGIRKRSYYSSQTTMVGCLSAHVWLGLSLVLLVPLHAGFSVGPNVHTLAYVVMLIVVGSGIWGAMAYIHLPGALQSHRGGGSLPSLLEQLQLASREIEATMQQKSDLFIQFVRRIDVPFRPSIAASFFGPSPTILSRSILGELVAKLPESERVDALAVIGTINRKCDIAARIRSETRTFTCLRLWLYIHVPFTILLLIVLAIHIFSVFYLW